VSTRRRTELAVGATALAATWILAREAARIPAWEEALTLAINRWPEWVRYPLWAPMQLGSAWMIAAAPIGLAVTLRRPRPALAALLATGGAWLLAKVVKEVVGRGRPAEFFGDVVVRESGVTGNGFVSGHSAVAFAAATVVGAYLPKPWAIGGFVLAGVVSVSRIYYGAHFPLDVVGGAGLGIGCGALALWSLREPSVGPNSAREESQ
jgi:membrane-associated phospholipid phosphatase